MSSLLRVPGGSESRKAERFGLGLVFNRSMSCRIDSPFAAGLAFRGGAEVGREGMAFSVNLSITTTHEKPTPDPSRFERTPGRGSCHVGGAPESLDGGRAVRFTAEVESKPSSPAAPSGFLSLGINSGNGVVLSLTAGNDGQVAIGTERPGQIEGSCP